MRTPKTKYLKLAIISVILVFLLAGSKNLTCKARIRLTDSIAPSVAAPGNIFTAISKFTPFASLRDQNKALRNKIDAQARALEEAKSIYAENQRLKDLLALRKTLGYSTVTAQVIGRDPSNWSDSIIIDKGSDGGVVANKAVISSKGLVGRVVELGRRSAKILLITDPNSKVGVVLERNRQGGMLLGRSDGTCKMIYIALDSDIAKGDKIVTAGLGSAFPKNIPAGEVISVGKEPGRLYKYAIIKPVDDLSKLEEVLCVK